MRTFVTSILFSLTAVNAKAAVTLKPAMDGCPSSGYARLVNVSSSAQLSSAMSSAQPGDQIRLAAGTYSAAYLMSKSGSSSAPITICGVKGVWPVIKGYTFKISASYLNLTGLLFEGPNGDNNNVFMANSRDVLFTHNEIRNGSFHAGLSVDSCANIEISHNFIHDNGKTDIDHGIYYRHQTGRNVIANNVIVNNYGRGISMHDNDGDAINDSLVVNNTIVRNGSTGILVATNLGTSNIVANNVLADNGWINGYKQIRVIAGATGATAGGNSLMNNIVWSPTSSRQGIEISAGGNSYSQNLTQDPMFVSNYSDLHLRSGSPAIGLALASYAANSSLDAGAYQSGSVSTPTPTPVPTATPVATPTPTATPVATPVSTPSSGAKVLSIAVSEDATVNSAYPNANAGKKTFLAINNSPKVDALLKFNVSGIGSSAIKSVKIRMIAAGSASSSGGEVHRVLSNSWSEASVTYKTAPASDATVLSRAGSTVKGQVVELDVTSAVIADGIYSFKLSNSQADGNSYDYYSREKGASYQPQLIITLY